MDDVCICLDWYFWIRWWIWISFQCLGSVICLKRWVIVKSVDLFGQGSIVLASEVDCSVACVLVRRGWCPILLMDNLRTMVDGLVLSLLSIDIMMVLHDRSERVLQVVFLSVLLHDHLLVNVLRLCFLSFNSSNLIDIFILFFAQWWVSLGLQLRGHNLANFLIWLLWLNLRLLDQPGLSWALRSTATHVWIEIINLDALSRMSPARRGWVSWVHLDLVHCLIITLTVSITLLATTPSTQLLRA